MVFPSRGLILILLGLIVSRIKALSQGGLTESLQSELPLEKPENERDEPSKYRWLYNLKDITIYKNDAIEYDLSSLTNIDDPAFAVNSVKNTANITETFDENEVVSNITSKDCKKWIQASENEIIFLCGGRNLITLKRASRTAKFEESSSKSFNLSKEYSCVSIRAVPGKPFSLAASCLKQVTQKDKKIVYQPGILEIDAKKGTISKEAFIEGLYFDSQKTNLRLLVKEDADSQAKSKTRYYLFERGSGKEVKFHLFEEGTTDYKYMGLFDTNKLPGCVASNSKFYSLMKGAKNDDSRLFLVTSDKENNYYLSLIDDSKPSEGFKCNSKPVLLTKQFSETETNLVIKFYRGETAFIDYIVVGSSQKLLLFQLGPGTQVNSDVPADTISISKYDLAYLKAVYLSGDIMFLIAVQQHSFNTCVILVRRLTQLSSTEMKCFGNDSKMIFFMDRVLLKKFYIFSVKDGNVTQSKVNQMTLKLDFASQNTSTFFVTLSAWPRSSPNTILNKTFSVLLRKSFYDIELLKLPNKLDVYQRNPNNEKNAILPLQSPFREINAAGHILTIEKNELSKNLRIEIESPIFMPLDLGLGEETQESFKHIVEMNQGYRAVVTDQAIRVVKCIEKKQSNDIVGLKIDCQLFLKFDFEANKPRELMYAGIHENKIAFIMKDPKTTSSFLVYVLTKKSKENTDYSQEFSEFKYSIIQAMDFKQILSSEKFLLAFTVQSASSKTKSKSSSKISDPSPKPRVSLFTLAINLSKTTSKTKTSSIPKSPTFSHQFKALSIKSLSIRTQPSLVSIDILAHFSPKLVVYRVNLGVCKSGGDSGRREGCAKIDDSYVVGSEDQKVGFCSYSETLNLFYVESGKMVSLVRPYYIMKSRNRYKKDYSLLDGKANKILQVICLPDKKRVHLIATKPRDDDPKVEDKYFISLEINSNLGHVYRIKNTLWIPEDFEAISSASEFNEDGYSNAENIILINRSKDPEDFLFLRITDNWNMPQLKFVGNEKLTKPESGKIDLLTTFANGTSIESFMNVNIFPSTLSLEAKKVETKSLPEVDKNMTIPLNSLLETEGFLSSAYILTSNNSLKKSLDPSVQSPLIFKQKLSQVFASSEKSVFFGNYSFEFAKGNLYLFFNQKMLFSSTFKASNLRVVFDAAFDSYPTFFATGLSLENDSPKQAILALRAVKTERKVFWIRSMFPVSEEEILDFEIIHWDNNSKEFFYAAKIKKNNKKSIKTGYISFTDFGTSDQNVEGTEILFYRNLKSFVVRSLGSRNALLLATLRGTSSIHVLALYPKTIKDTKNEDKETIFFSIDRPEFNQTFTTFRRLQCAGYNLDNKQITCVVFPKDSAKLFLFTLTLSWNYSPTSPELSTLISSLSSLPSLPYHEVSTSLISSSTLFTLSMPSPSPSPPQAQPSSSSSTSPILSLYSLPPSSPSLLLSLPIHSLAPGVSLSPPCPLYEVYNIDDIDDQPLVCVVVNRLGERLGLGFRPAHWGVQVHSLRTLTHEQIDSSVLTLEALDGSKKYFPLTELLKFKIPPSKPYNSDNWVFWFWVGILILAPLLILIIFLVLAYKYGYFEKCCRKDKKSQPLVEGSFCPSENTVLGGNSKGSLIWESGSIRATNNDTIEPSLPA